MEYYTVVHRRNSREGCVQIDNAGPTFRPPNAPSVALSAAAAAPIHLRPRLDDLLHRAVSGERRERLTEGAPHRGNLAAEPFGG